MQHQRSVDYLAQDPENEKIIDDVGKNIDQTM